ncbi:MAG: 6-hydroxymethylpterin diphosphokinase MptE-like protein [Candidatus Hodarchaeales archaeon]|jgi:uncharacterized Rossmann fold enzyme
MQLDKWNIEYLKIVSDLNLNIAEDIHSTNQLESILQTNLGYNSNYVLKRLIKKLDQPILIVGAGPSLETDFNNCKRYLSFENIVTIAVDGSCSLFQELQIVPNIVLTDLDGEWSAIRWAISSGAITLIHAHGDNLSLIQKFFEEKKSFVGNTCIWGTTQNMIETNLFNFGGFTDGDRAIFLSFHFNSPIIGLIGFDFGETIGKYSTLNPLITKDPIRKLQKFNIALTLLASHFHSHKGARFNLTSSGEEIPGFPRVSLNDFKNNLIEWNRTRNKLEFPKVLP